jgi:hypothetical protein
MHSSAPQENAASPRVKLIGRSNAKDLAVKLPVCGENSHVIGPESIISYLRLLLSGRRLKMQTQKAKDRFHLLTDA